MSKPLRARRLQAIALWINEHCPELESFVNPSECNTDRKIGRLRWPGKGRKGTRILVHNKRTKACLLDHNSAETYRTNSEVERWLAEYIERKRHGTKEP